MPRYGSPCFIFQVKGATAVFFAVAFRHEIQEWRGYRLKRKEWYGTGMVLPDHNNC